MVLLATGCIWQGATGKTEAWRMGQFANREETRENPEIPGLAG